GIAAMKFYVICGLAMALGVAMYMGGYYCTEYMKQLSINNNQITEIQQLTDRINYQNTHIEMLHELDAKYTQELTNAKSKITQLGDDLCTHQ
ncbi:lysis system i-spanin subunit Rz, partial [Xenorhabdus szentirmaii]